MTATLTRTVRRAGEVPPHGSRLGEADDRDLVARVAGGDRDALGELYRRHHRLVTSFVRSRVHVAADAEDLAHEAFLAAAAEAGDYEPGSGLAVQSWLCGHASRTVRHYAWNDRHRQLVATNGVGEQLRRPVTETAAEREGRPLSEPVRAALEQLPPAQRRAVQLRYLEGLGDEQAAEVAGVTRNTMASTVAEARRRLARQLAEHAPPVREPESALAAMPVRQAARVAVKTVGYPNALAWLREQGVRVSEHTVYRANKDLQVDPDGKLAAARAADRAAQREAQRAESRWSYLPSPEVMALERPTQRARAAVDDYVAQTGRQPGARTLARAVQVGTTTARVALQEADPERTRQLLPDGPAYTPPEQVSTLRRPRDRAHAVSVDYHAQRGQLPTWREVVAAADVSETTARRAIHLLSTQPASGHHPKADRPAHDATAGPPASADQQHDRDRHAHRPRPDPNQRHRVAVHSQAAHPAAPARDHHATRHQRAPASEAAGRTDEHTDSHGPVDREPAEAGPPPAQVSIARARVALAVINAHRAEQDQRQTAEQARSAQLARWHHEDDHGSQASTRRARDRATDGEDHTR